MGGTTRVFRFRAQLFALVPAVPGVFLRRAFYRLTLEYCDWDSKISFGTVLSDSRTRVESCYVGLYAIIGSARLGRNCLIGSRASIVNGTHLHVLQSDGKWSPAQTSSIKPISIGDNAWIGEGAIVMSDVGDGARSQPVRSFLRVCRHGSSSLETLQGLFER